MESPINGGIWIKPEMSPSQISNRINNITGTRSKSLYRLECNIIHFINSFGLDHCGFLTLTFPERITPKEAQRRFNSLRPILARMFDSYIGVLGFHKDGRPHFHLVVASEHDLRAGFDEAAYTEFHRLARVAYHQNRPMTAEEKAQRRALKPRISNNAILQAYSVELSKRLPAYGFGKALAFHVTPIRRNAEAVARYLRKNVVNAYAESRYPKGVRAVRYSQSAPQIINSTRFSWNSPGSSKYRQKLKIVAARYDCHSLDDLRREFGPQWFRHLWRDIQEIRDFDIPALLKEDPVVQEWLSLAAFCEEHRKMRREQRSRRILHP